MEDEQLSPEEWCFLRDEFTAKGYPYLGYMNISRKAFHTARRLLDAVSVKPSRIRSSVNDSIEIEWNVPHSGIRWPDLQRTVYLDIDRYGSLNSTVTDYGDRADIYDAEDEPDTICELANISWDALLELIAIKILRA